MNPPTETTTETLETSGATRVEFDLAKVLTADELEKFVAASKAAGASSLTEHFLNLTLRIPRAA